MSEFSDGRLPDFVIAGTQKGGTTSLHHALAMHSEIFFPAKQELHFFDHDEEYAKGAEQYRAHFSSARPKQLIGQTSPLYMYEPAVADRMFGLIPNVKLIFILRDPVARAYSHYWHSVRFGFESMGFEDALAGENDRIMEGALSRRNFSYVDRGRYAGQLDRFETLYGSSKMLVVTLDQLKASQASVLDRCLRFIGVDPNSADPTNSTNSTNDIRYNTAKRPRIRRVQQLRPALVRIAGRQAGSALDRVNLRTAKYPEMSSTTRSSLEELFESEVELLARWFKSPELSASWFGSNGASAYGSTGGGAA